MFEVHHSDGSVEEFDDYDRAQRAMGKSGDRLVDTDADRTLEQL